MRRSTVIILLLFVIVVGAYYFIKYRKEAAPVDTTATPEATTQVSFLFDAQDGVPTSIKIESKAGETAEVARNADNVWAIVKPFEASADQGLAEAAASQVTAMLVQEKIQNVDLDILGLKSPEYVLTIKFTSGVERKAEIGVVTPSESGYYVRNEKGDIVIVSKDSVDALLGLLTNPPYVETPTPSPTATETSLPSSTPEAVATETATPTP
ncbi:MAG: DUF4340 domain-containing protein [Anaerolineales bacterium]